MIDPGNVPPVEESELLARVILNSGEFRKGNNTIKPQAFIPYRHVELSVNRHRDCSNEEMWTLCRQVASARDKQLYGLTNILAENCRQIELDVVKAPIAGNPNHANVVGYPEAKEDQILLGQKLADNASLLQTPPEDSDSI